MYLSLKELINNKADFTLIFRKESGDVVNLCVAAQYQDELSLFFVADVAGDSYDEDSIYYPKEIAEKIITFLTQDGKTLKESLTEHMGYLHVIDNIVEYLSGNGFKGERNRWWTDYKTGESYWIVNESRLEEK